MGPTWSFLAEAGAPIIESANIVSYQPANTSEFVATKSSYMFFGANKNAGKEKPVTAWLKENGKKRVAMILDSSSWGESHLAPFKNAVEAAGGEIVLTERIPFGAEVDTMPTVLAKIVGAKADVILTTGYEDGLTIFMQKVQQLGINMPVIMASDIPPALVKRGTVSLRPEDEFYIVTVKPAEEFAKKFEAKYGEAPGNYADRAYDGLMLLVDAIQKKDADESLDNYLYQTTNYKGFATTYDFDDRGDIVGGDWVIEKLK